MDHLLWLTLLDSIGEAVIALDADGVVIAWNSAAEALYGWTKSEVIGLPLAGLLGTTYNDPEENQSRAFTTLHRDGVWKGTVHQKRKDGTPLMVDSTVRYYEDASQRKRGLIAVNRDVTEKEKLRLIFQRMEEFNRNLPGRASITEIFQVYVNHIRDILPFDRIELWLLGTENGVVRVSGQFTRQRGFFSSQVASPIRETPLALVRYMRKPMVVNDLRGEKQFNRSPLFQPDDRAFLLLPLMREVEVFGAVVIVRSASGGFSMEDATFLLPSAEQVGRAIIQNELIDSLQAQVEANRALIRDIQQEVVQRQELSRTLVRLQEREREHLSREFHDEIGQSLTALFLNLRALQSAVDPAKNELHRNLEESLGIASRLMEQVRSISLDLHPKILDDLGFIPALRWLVNRTGKLAKAKIRLDLPRTLEPISKDVEYSCFRIIQEGLTNILRHADATNIILTLAQDQSHTTISLIDDGKGFSADYSSIEQLPPNVFGLYSMFARADLIEARLRVTSSPGKGTALYLDYRHGQKN